MTSLAIGFNQTDTKFHDENGNILSDGTHFLSDKKTIIRLRDGFLDGDIFDENGKFIKAMPAIEGEGHIEYWRQNKIHRDNGEPAIITNDFTEKQYWENGERKK